MFYYTGNFSPYLISYLRNRTGEVDLRNVDGLWVISVGAAGNSFGITTGGILDKRFGPRIAIGLGTTIFRLVTVWSFLSFICFSACLMSKTTRLVILLNQSNENTCMSLSRTRLCRASKQGAYNVLNKSENATLQLSIFYEKVLDKKYLLKLNNVAQTSSKGFVETPPLYLV